MHFMPSSTSTSTSQFTVLVIATFCVLILIPPHGAHAHVREYPLNQLRHHHHHHVVDAQAQPQPPVSRMPLPPPPKLLSSTTSLTAPLEAEVHASLFNKVTAIIIPVLSKAVANLTIPGQSLPHFTFNSFKIEEFNIGSVDVAFEAPNNLRVNIRNLSLQVPPTDFSVWVRIIVKESCNGQFWATIGSGTNATFTMALVERNKKLEIGTVSNVSVAFGPLSIHHKFSGLCEFLQKLIEIFTGNLDALIKSVLEKYIGPLLQKELAGMLNDVFSKLPFQITAPPSSPPGSDAMIVDIDLNSLVPNSSSLATTRSKSNHHRHHRPVFQQEHFSPRKDRSNFQRHRQPANLVVSSSSPSRDVSATLPQQSLNNLFTKLTDNHLIHFSKTLDNVTTTQIFRKSMPAAYDECKDCPLNIALDATVPPVAMLQPDNTTVILTNLSIQLSGVLPWTVHVVPMMNPLFDLGVDAVASIDNFTFQNINQTTYLQFDVEIESISIIQLNSHVGPVDVKFLDWVAKLLTDFIVPIINGIIRSDGGIPLTKPIDGIMSLANWKVNTTKGAFVIGMDVDFP